MNKRKQQSLDAMLVRAAKHDKLDIAKEFLGEGAYINARDKKERTVLHWFALHDNTEGLLFFIEQGADINATDIDKYTALHHAAYWGGSVDCMKMLIEHGADLDLKNIFGQTPLDTFEEEYWDRYIRHSNEITALALSVKKLKEEDSLFGQDIVPDFEI